MLDAISKVTLAIFIVSKITFANFDKLISTSYRTLARAILADIFIVCHILLLFLLLLLLLFHILLLLLISYKILESRKIFPILHSAPCDSNYIRPCTFIFQKQWIQFLYYQLQTIITINLYCFHFSHWIMCFSGVIVK